MSNCEFARFGERRSFAIEARLMVDPDPPEAQLAESWSFGEFRLYVRDRCLTRHTVPGGLRDEIRWYLAPLFDWLSRAWSPLFHEQRFPVSVGSHEHPIVRFEQGERLLLDDAAPAASVRRAEMQAWRRRHALWTAAAGGVFPNVWIRRQSDLCEVSYDPGTTVGTPGVFEFNFSRGVALIDVDLVSRAALHFLEWGAARGAATGRHVGRPEDSVAAAESAERWFVGDHLSTVLSQANVERPRLTHGIIDPLSPEVAMFGTLTPNLSAEDAGVLLRVLHAARSTEPEPPILASLTTDMPPATRETSWEQGYDLATRTLETLGVDEAATTFVDVETILNGLGVQIRDLSVDDLSLRGVAIAGEGFRPTVIVNAEARWNRSRPGRRFTLAHELGHIIVDRGRARRVTHSSTPWAPEAVERRANAFAAMFLMPYRSVDAAIGALGPVENGGDLARLARQLGCGKTAVLEHLNNIDRIEPDVFFKLKSESAEA